MWSHLVALPRYRRSTPFPGDGPNKAELCPLCGEAAQEEIQAALAAGFAAYLTKPVDFEAFDHALDRIFRVTSSQHIDLPTDLAP